MRPSTARNSRGLCALTVERVVDEINQRCASHLPEFRLPPSHLAYAQRVELAVECADVNPATHDGGVELMFSPIFNSAKSLAVFSREHVKPAGFVAKHHSSIDHWRRSPDRPAHQLLPDDLPFVGAEAIHETVVRSNVNPILNDDGLAQNPLRSL